MFFQGQYEHTIDAKGRVAIPKPIRAAWRPEHDGDALCALPWAGGVIRLYTARDFEARARMGEESLIPDPDEAQLRTTLFGLSTRLPLDSAGRIRLPEEMIQQVGLPTEVALVGAGDWLEIQDRAVWRASKAHRLEQIPEIMKRLAAKQRHLRNSAGA